FYVKDTKSSSGTFLNHVRLSPANTESRPCQIKDGDILQLGVDYQGGAEDIYKSVKIRIELGREWQASANAFNTNALKNLKSLALPGLPGVKQPLATVKLPSNGKSQIPDCCICLFSVTIRQALFIAPCSHTFHYKCIRPLLESHHPAFSCPLCRTFADLEEDVEIEVEYIDQSEDGDHLVDGKASASGGEEIDIDVGSPPSDENGVQPPPHHDALMMEDMLPASRSNSGLGVRGEREGGGAETEVEGEGSSGAGIMSRMRAARRGNTPARNHAGGSGSGEGASPLPDFPTDEQEEDMMDVSQHHHYHHHPHAGASAEMGGVALDELDGDDGVVDLDGTVEILGTEKGIDALVDFLYATAAFTRTGKKLKKRLAPIFDDEPEVEDDSDDER
ncbi:hypothetical protein M413DRAFT_30139, partial [Hebeloma cylindrosporum]